MYNITVLLTGPGVPGSEGRVRGETLGFRGLSVLLVPVTMAITVVISGVVGGSAVAGLALHCPRDSVS